MTEAKTERNSVSLASGLVPILAIFTQCSAPSVCSESVVSIQTFLAERRFVFYTNKFQLSSVVMSASAKTNYLIFAAFVAFLSISTLPQLCRGQGEC